MGFCLISCKSSLFCAILLFIRVTAMALVWQYGEKSGNETWKGLSWGMVSFDYAFSTPLALMPNLGMAVLFITGRA